MTRGKPIKNFILLLSALLALISFCAPALAETDEDQQTLEMFYEGKDLVVSATRSPKPISQTAENVTIITAADIEAMGAHNLPEVLNNVPGLQTDDRGSVGTFSGVSVQGADMFHVLFLLDGVTLNFFSDGSADIATIPVQNIERIEIIKGPGSSSWGSALGGVVNIVTKSPLEEKKLGGTLSFSTGERETRDSRGEASGSVGNLGYYLYAGNLTSGGLRPHTAVDENNLYAKLRWNLPERGSLLYTLAYTKGAAGGGQVDSYDISIDGRHRYFISTLAFNYPLDDRTDLDLSLRTTSRTSGSTVNTLSAGDVVQDSSGHEETYGGSAKLTMRRGIQSLAMGADFDHVRLNTSAISPLYVVTTEQDVRSDKWGIFFNDTITLGNVAVTPGIRYDQLHPVGNFISPSLGVAWSLDDKTVLRAYAARGYSLPVILPGSTQEKVLTFQVGAETSRIPYLWLKTTLFLNYISDHQGFGTDADGNTITILKKQKKQGVEVEARTTPLFNTSLAAGCTFVDARDRETNETLQGVPRQIVKLGLRYDDRNSLKGSLLGRFVWWNASPDDHPRDGAVIWDLNLSKRVLAVRDTALELFFTAHNLFNGAQFSWGDAFKNPRRWVEGGARFKF